MPEMQMGAVESRFADIIWKNAPLTASQLAKLADTELGWKKTTSYTALKRLCEKGIFRNEGGMVHAILSREQFYALQSEKFLEDTYNGSLPAFIAAFASRKAISPAELAQIRQMLDEYEKGGSV